MPKRFAWVSDISQGEWLRPLEAEPPSSVLSIVPSGFEAYARVFHPVERDRLKATKTWQGIDQEAFFSSTQDITSVIEREPTTWSAAAESFGTSMHPQAQYARLVRQDHYGADDAISRDGWRYTWPDEGNIDAVSLAAAAAVLARHTTTPGSGIAAIWEGWGGLVGAGGAMKLVSSSEETMPALYSDNQPRRLSAAAIRTLIANVAARLRISRAGVVLQSLPGLAAPAPEIGTGLLPPEVATGPRFELDSEAGRQYLLFEAGVDDFADPTWPAHAPWVDEAVWPQSPSILWPDDHSWALATEIDYDSTIIAGTHALIRELVRTPGLEVLPIPPDANLTWDGDTLNPRN